MRGKKFFSKIKNITNNVGKKLGHGNSAPVDSGEEELNHVATETDVEVTVEGDVLEQSVGQSLEAAGKDDGEDSDDGSDDKDEDDSAGGDGDEQDGRKNDDDDDDEGDNDGDRGGGGLDLDDLGDDDFNMDDMLEGLEDEKTQDWDAFRNCMLRRARDLGRDPPEGQSYNGLSPTMTADEIMLEDDDLDRWNERLKREEIFSRRYRLSKEEQNELGELKSELCSEAGSGSVFNFSFGSSGNAGWDEFMRSESNSVIVKRGPVLVKTITAEGEEEKEVELVVLTSGLLLAPVDPTATPDAQSPKKVVCKFERGLKWKGCLTVGPERDPLTWDMICQNEGKSEFLTFIAGSERQRNAWVDALEVVLVQYHINNKTASAELGWQYRLIRKPGFAMAVTGVLEEVSILTPAVVNKIDSYNGYAPLHYAIKKGNEKAIERLLEANADPNLNDEDGRPPILHAIMEEAPKSTITLLESYGAEGADEAQAEKEELFERVKATEEMREERREEVEHQKAVKAQAQMSENLRLLNERGQKIEEAADKAQEMNQNAADYADMAKLLKEKMKKKASWNPFS